jgi:hypothetical protein
MAFRFATHTTLEIFILASFYTIPIILIDIIESARPRPKH